IGTPSSSIYHLSLHDALPISEGPVHRWVSGVYWRLVRVFAFPDFPSMGYDFCLLDRQVVDDINRINEKNSSIFVLIYWLGYRPVDRKSTRLNSSHQIISYAVF